HDAKGIGAARLPRHGGGRVGADTAAVPGCGTAAAWNAGAASAAPGRASARAAGGSERADGGDARLSDLSHGRVHRGLRCGPWAAVLQLRRDRDVSGDRDVLPAAVED